MKADHILLGASPFTGDSFPTWPLLILILAALAIITFIILKRQNKKTIIDFAQINLETDVPDTSFTADKTADFTQTRKIYDAGSDDDFDDEYNDDVEDAYERDQRNFEISDDDDDEDE